MPKKTDAEIEEAEIADAEITGAEIADDEIADDEIADAEIADDEIADAEIADAEIADAEIADAEIADAEIADVKIADAEITDAEIAEAKKALDKKLYEGEIEDYSPYNLIKDVNEKLAESLKKLIEENNLDVDLETGKGLKEHFFWHSYNTDEDLSVFSELDTNKYDPADESQRYAMGKAIGNLMSKVSAGRLFLRRDPKVDSLERVKYSDGTMEIGEPFDAAMEAYNKDGELGANLSTGEGMNFAFWKAKRDIGGNITFKPVFSEEVSENDLQNANDVISIGVQERGDVYHMTSDGTLRLMKYDKESNSIRMEDPFQMLEGPRPNANEKKPGILKRIARLFSSDAYKDDFKAWHDEQEAERKYDSVLRMRDAFESAKAENQEGIDREREVRAAVTEEARSQSVEKSVKALMERKDKRSMTAKEVYAVLDTLQNKADKQFPGADIADLIAVDGKPFSEYMKRTYESNPQYKDKPYEEIAATEEHKNAVAQSVHALMKDTKGHRVTAFVPQGNGTLDAKICLNFCDSHDERSQTWKRGEKTSLASMQTALKNSKPARQSRVVVQPQENAPKLVNQSDGPAIG